MTQGAKYFPVFFILLIINFFCAVAQEPRNLSAEQAVRISYSGASSYYFTERTDLRRYDNGTYIGLVSREVRAFIAPESVTDSKNLASAGALQNNAYSDANNYGGNSYDGNFYIVEKTVRNMTGVAKSVHDAIPARFTITAGGEFVMYEDNGYPSFRSFPAFSDKHIKLGESWSANAVRTVDPLNKGVFTRIPMYVNYTYIGDEMRDNEAVYVLRAQWATRYGNAIIKKDGDDMPRFDEHGDVALLSVSGSHNATMHISKATGRVIVVRDSVDETYVYADGKRIQFKGTISLFTEYPPSVEKEKIIPAVERVAHVTYESTASGLKLTIENLQFKADSAELLSGEASRLDEIASSLKVASASQFLVEGHTAATGNENGEMTLSLERAHTIATELAKRGIDADKFICKGSGAHKPIASNETQEGRAKNRRVEITILE